MAVEIFFCYAREDESLLNKLKAHLSPLQHQSIINVWYDHDISAGVEWEKEINKHLNTAQIILLLVSPDFMASDYCYSFEMKRALERHERGEARVIPVILRHVLWRETPLGMLQVLPTNAKPIIDSSWHDLDTALFNVATGIAKALEELVPKSSGDSLAPDIYSHPIEPEEFTLIQTLELDFPPITSLATSFDGQILASGSADGSIDLWDLNTGKQVQRLVGKANEKFISLAVSCDKQILTSSSSLTSSIRLWNLQTGELRCNLEGHKSAITHVAISPDGQTLVSSCFDHTIKLWNLQTGELLYTFEEPSLLFGQVAISLDGQTFASGGTYNSNTIKVWNLRTRELLCTLQGPNYILSVAISTDNQILASGNVTGKITTWNLRTGKLLYTLQGHSSQDRVVFVAISPDKHTLISGGTDNMIKFWNLNTGELLRVLTGYSGESSHFTFSANGRTLAKGSDGIIELWGRSRQ